MVELPNLAAKLESLPDGPGCYLHKDSAGSVLYVGKAKNLRNRVRQYFQAGRGQNVKVLELAARIVDFETIVTDNEVEALLLESHLIKQYQPRFNALLKDDKQWPYLKLTIKEEFPRVFKTRRHEKDGSLYFGPYLPAALADQTWDLIGSEFQLRPCSDEVFRMYQRRGRPCLQYQIKRCLGPCVPGLCGKEQYEEAVQDVRMLLDGKNDDLKDDLERRMTAASDETRYEAAARYRDLAAVVERLSLVQKMAFSSGTDVDIFGLHREERKLAVFLFTMREGRVVGKREFYWEEIPEALPAAEFLGQVLVQYYSAGDFVPHELHLPVELEDHDVIAEWLSQKRGRKVAVLDPKRGVKRELVDLAERNARQGFDQRFRVLRQDPEQLLAALAEALDLAAPPGRIEAFDISNIQGTDSVASMVVCVEGRMKRSDYRRFIIRTVKGTDDFASMKEVTQRRYARLQRENRPMPDLILIDGGKGQLSAAGAALSELGLVSQPLASIAKREEIIYVRGREDEPVVLEHSSPVLRLVQQIRDEAHRFAVTFHRLRRKRRHLTSELLEIPGIGERYRDKLLRNFGSVERVRQASVAELTPFLGQKLAQRVFDHFRREPDRHA
ncbi:MAG: excinuclease ABC subunit UvrC [Acidobacteria bacterium]|nr:excinuclease ABC subunit UvrC [Acidobacteriota bacterium]